MPRRPQREDDYDEILRQQENFLKKNAPGKMIKNVESDRVSIGIGVLLNQKGKVKFKYFSRKSRTG